MSETALYRKYRPHDFKGVLGQDHVVRVLEGAIKSGNIAHAYLFCGTRGTGKTSVARIFANAIGTSSSDLYEIDAASNRGIDDIRELREAVKTFPFEGKYKVYIIDEVHMLTKEAGNALLKTLEEPPAHVIFILATTDAHKVLDTVLSRCQVFTFKKPPIETLKNLVLEISKKEERVVDHASAELIALLGDGSFRDTLVTLQKVLYSSDAKKISAEEVERITGVPKSAIVNEFISAINDQNASGAFSAIRRITDENIDIAVFLKLVLTKLRAVMLLRLAPDMRTALSDDFTVEDFKFLSELPINKELKLSLALTVFLEASDDIAKAFIPQLPVELAVAKLFQAKEH
ncbi:MAG: DNA polymerase III subunit gamma/tau [Candidatus Paceibacterota bacterium]|jgi:DNA polymerase-3 subunit gamma/tau|nr:DNA polymerase III subunit gamma/tau [Candidatus Paceibacterota bacterium]